MNKIKKFVIGILLFIVSLLSMLVVIPWGLIETGVSLLWKKRFLKGMGALGEFFLMFATIIDVMGNVILQIPLNRILNTKKGYQFGSRFDTVSYVLGRGEYTSSLSKNGFLLCKILDKIDKDHCKKAYGDRLKNLK